MKGNPNATNHIRLLAIACFLATVACGFVTPPHRQRRHPRNADAVASSSSSPPLLLLLLAKKDGSGSNNNNNKKKNIAGQGFGRAPEIPPTPPKKPAPTYYGDGDGSTATEERDGAGGLLSSVDGGSGAVPTIDPVGSTPEERATSILRDRYGMRSREEQQEAYRKEQKVKEDREKLQEWKKLADEGKDFDIMEVLPAPVLVGIDFFLKAGVTVCTVLFVLAGMGITVEAWSKSSGSPLPEGVDDFIVTVVEPNFTPGLGVLLGFSICLGAFAAAQLSSSSATYRQDR